MASTGGSQAAAAAAPAPSQPASKAAAAAPKLNSEVELGNLQGGDAAANQQDIMHLARIGDVSAMEKLFESGDYDATYSDDEGITPLHWAAMNNQYAMCKFLIDRGAEVNKKGGESVATPLQWAAQRSHYYTVNLLLQHGADPLISDAQGYNTLHISTFNGNVLLPVLLLHQGIPVDVLDANGHTALMWSAYKGFPQSVDVFLRWGASVHAVDEQGFTALHWALVKGNTACIQKLIEYGADRFAKSSTGKTPAATAQELNTLGAWHRALRESGYDEEGHLATPGWPGSSYLLKDRRGFVTKFTFLLPFVIIWVMISILAHMPVYFGVPMSLLAGYTLQWCAQQVLEYGPADMRILHKTPWLAGIFAASLFLVGLTWLTKVMPRTTLSAIEEPHWWLNLLFAGFYSMTTYFYVTTMMYDPGFVPKMNGIAEQKAAIDELLKLWKFDEAHFCVTCMIRTPLRSKHCRRCRRCVAKHDHHCPWVNNCVGINNHRHFFLYLINLTLGVLTLDWLLYYYFSTASTSASDSCNVLSPSLCKLVNTDAYTLIVGFWATLQLTWVSMLLFVQFVQVSRAMTTYENMYGIQDTSITSAFTSTGAPLDPNHPSLASAPPAAGDHGHGGHGGHGHKHRSKMQTWARLLGVDPFLETIKGNGAATGSKNKRKRNPYSHGCMTNCKDFWCDPQPFFGKRENGASVLAGEGVNYAELYENPAWGEVTRGRSTRRTGGYEAVAAEEV